MVYCVDDPIAAKQLEEAGAVAIMPLGAPIGSGLGIQNRVTIRLIVEGAGVPVLVDAGVGTASDAAQAMELGCDGVLMNTAIAEAKDPVLMARAMKAAVEAGRLAYLAGRMQKRRYADPEQPAGRAYLVAVTMCADIGASKPWSPSNWRSAASTASSKVRSSASGRRFVDLDAHRRAIARPLAASSAADGSASQLDRLDLDFAEAGGAQVALDPLRLVVAERPALHEQRRVHRETARRTRPAGDVGERGCARCCPRSPADNGRRRAARAAPRHCPAPCRDRTSRRTGRRRGRSLRPRTAGRAHRLAGTRPSRTSPASQRRRAWAWLRSVATISASGSARCSAAVTTPVPAAVSRIRAGRIRRARCARLAHKDGTAVGPCIARNSPEPSRRSGGPSRSSERRPVAQRVSLDVRRWTMATTMTDYSAEREAMVERQLKRRGITRAARSSMPFSPFRARSSSAANMRTSPMATIRCRSRPGRPSRNPTSSR